jgi:pimeloyl-[acyl-carrier protein] methyl ester esterase
VRIEDIDPPREVPGAADGILHTLEAFDLEWDREVLRQSTRFEAYRHAAESLGRSMRKSTLADGRQISWREAGSGPAVVLLHGWSMSSAVFTEVIEELSVDFRLLAPDLRGHGGSDPGAGYAFTDFAADLAEWIQALDLREVALVGWSLGGQVALELCPALRERLRRLILVGTTPRFTAAADWTAGLPDLQVRAMARDLKRNYLKTMGDFFALQFAGEELPRERHRRIADFAVRGGRLPEPEVALAALETLRLGDQRIGLGAINVPALVQHGELDRITLPGAAEYLAVHLTAAKLELLPAIGHAPFLSQPQEVCRRWREFLL